MVKATMVLGLELRQHPTQQKTALFAYWCIALGAIPGVAVGFSAYLLLRMRQTHTQRTQSNAAKG
jgi:hypothetical protein